MFGAVVECGDVSKGAATRPFETAAPRHRDLLEGFQAINSKTGTDDIDAAQTALTPTLQALIEVRAKPRFATEA